MRFILDFDYTLFNTEAMRRAMALALAKHGVSDERYRETEQAAKASGVYTLEDHLQAMATGPAVDELQRSVYAVLESAEQFLYPDVIPFLQQIQEQDVTILSFGSPQWQERKIRDSGVDALADHVITTDQDKAAVIQQYAGQDVTVINDRGSEIDAMYAVMPQARYIWIRRAGTPYRDETCQHATETVDTLSLGLAL